MIYVNARAIIYRNVNNNTQIIIQTRNRPGEPSLYELPGGQINQFESITDALIREVKEETGLDIEYIQNIETEIITTGTDSDFTIQCIKPFAVYQTLKGFVDSFGVYFNCTADGQLKIEGDDTKNPHWISIDDLRDLINKKNAFSSIDKAAVIMFLKEFE